MWIPSAIRTVPAVARTVVPSEVTPYTVSLRDRDHRFLAGHRIMVQVQSTWFPIIDRNPQTWVPNIFEAVEEDFQKATKRVYRSAEHPTHITLLVNPAVNQIGRRPGLRVLPRGTSHAGKPDIVKHWPDWNMAK